MGSLVIFPARFLVLARYKNCREGRGIPIIFSTDLMVRWSLLMSFFVAAPNQTVMEEQRMDSMTAV